VRALRLRTLQLTPEYELSTFKASSCN